MEPTDLEEQLVSHARQGDLEAFNRLVERNQDAIYNLCFRLVGAREAAEDATQEAFLSAFRKLEQFRGGNFRAWLFRIAGNACYDELRRRRARPARSLDAPEAATAAGEIASGGPSPEEEAARRELAEFLSKALGNLPFDQRLAVLLCDREGFSYEEISTATGVSVGTVKSRISRGRERLRRLLLEHKELLPGRFRQ